jgi:hypothetical protein
VLHWDKNLLIIDNSPYQPFSFMIYRLFKNLMYLVTGLSITIFFGCLNNTENVLYVDNGGIGVKGTVFSKLDSLPLDSVKIELIDFKGINIQPSLGDVFSFSDTSGKFQSFGAFGYKVINVTDTVGYVKQCSTIFSKQGYIDTSFSVDISMRHQYLQIYLRQSQ